MRLLLDTNVLLDVALQRPGLMTASAGVISVCGGPHEAGISWHALSNIFYLIARHYHSSVPAWEYCRRLVNWTTVVSTGHQHAQRAMTLGFTDLEDAMQAVAAEAFLALFIITRNTKDFVSSTIPAVTPEEFLRLHHPHLLP